MLKDKIIVIAGPTGVGKTKLSVELAKKLNGEIINCDSLQVYKNMNIGTAKIKEAEKENIPHHLFDIVDVNEMYTIYDYQKDARKVIKNVLEKGKVPILVGGSGLYIRAALYDYKLDEEKDNKNFNNLTNEELYNKCLELDPNCDIHINNRKRLERYYNKLLNNSSIVSDSKPIYDFTIIGLTTDRDKLYEIVDKRVDMMVKDGLIDEVKSFFDRGIVSKSIMTGIGYKELYSYFKNEISLEDAIELIKKNSRHLVKRQYTFFNNQFKNIKWFNVDYNNFNNTINDVLNYLEA